LKRTRVRQYVERLTGWRRAWEGLRNQAFIMLDYEISIEDARRMFPTAERLWYNRGKTAVEVYAPLEVEVYPWPMK